ncbi:hypothetical protein AGOR_G00108700 [Albula goreensis]|uniref:Uncharacterized protein n=1 Tax=Albula goreensis TaxID=1534307 RepID=A0A8T3DDX2_9TELE|nr:hypothetical protein AGOR_G00108700 [Albula goreensis]
MAKARVLYDFIAEPGNNELSVKEGETVTITNQGIGGGWIEAQNSKGERGLVPEDYIEIGDASPGWGNSTSPNAVYEYIPSITSNIPSSHQASNGNDAWSTWNTETDAKSTSDWVDNTQAAGAGGAWSSSVQEHPQAYQGPGSMDDEEWDDEWDDGRSSVGYAESEVGEEGAAPRPGAHGSTMKIKFPFQKAGPEAYLLAKFTPKGKDRLPIYVGEVGPVWLYPESQLECIVADPKKGSKMYGLKSYIEYQVTPSTTNRPVNHRYKHFDWLYERLLEKFGSAIPIPRPTRQTGHRTF